MKMIEKIALAALRIRLIMDRLAPLFFIIGMTFFGFLLIYGFLNA